MHISSGLCRLVAHCSRLAFKIWPQLYLLAICARLDSGLIRSSTSSFFDSHRRHLISCMSGNIIFAANLLPRLHFSAGCYCLG